MESQPPAGAEGSIPHSHSDNSVEYSLFVIDSRLDPRKTLQQVDLVRKAALQLYDTLANDYIWQRDEFHLELRTEHGKNVLVFGRVCACECTTC